MKRLFVLALFAPLVALLVPRAAHAADVPCYQFGPDNGCLMLTVPMSPTGNPLSPLAPATGNLIRSTPVGFGPIAIGVTPTLVLPSAATSVAVAIDYSVSGTSGAQGCISYFSATVAINSGVCTNGFPITAGSSDGLYAVTRGAMPNSAFYAVAASAGTLVIQGTVQAPVDLTSILNPAPPPPVVTVIPQTGYALNSTPTASSVPALKSGFLATYVDTTSDAAMTQFEAWLGVTPHTYPTHVFSGNASEQDMTTSISYADGINSGGRPRVMSIPFAYHTGAVGGGLAGAASGANNADWHEQFLLLFDRLTHSKSTVPSSAPFGPGLQDDQTGSTDAVQSVLYIRLPWEFNQENPASQDWTITGGVGTAAQYATAAQNWVTMLRADAAAYVPSSGIPLPTFKIVWNFVPQGVDPTPAYPGDGFIDAVGPDAYYFLSAYANTTDPDAGFVLFRDQSYSLTWGENFAVTHGKLFALPEYAEDMDNFGQFEKLLYLWLANLPAAGQPGALAYASYWDGTFAGFSQKASDGVRAQSDAMKRHLWNPAAYPVEPTPYPNNVSAIGNNGSISITGLAVPSSANAVTIYLYEGTGPGLENTTTPVASVAASAGAPVFTRAVANGTQRCYQEGSARADGAGIFLSPETCATAAATPSNFPAHYVAFGSSGVAKTALTSNLISGSQPFSMTVDYCLASNSDLDTGSPSGHELAGIWSSASGYNQAYLFQIYSANYLTAIHDNSGNTAVQQPRNTTPAMAVSQCYEGGMLYTPSTGGFNFYHNALGFTGAATLVESNVNPNGPVNVGTPSNDPSSGVAPVLSMGAGVDGSNQFGGYISRVRIRTNPTAYDTGGTVVADAVANGTTGFTDASGRTWTLSGGATAH